jgi:EIN3-binding F-box protein
MDLLGCLRLAAHLERVRVRDTATGACGAWRPDLRKLWRAVRSVTWRLDANDESLAALAALCPQLKRLDVNRALGVTDAGVEAVAAGCPQLESLALEGTSVMLEGVVAVVRALLLLQELSLPVDALSAVDPVLVALAANCPRLRVLNLTGASATDDAFVAAVARWPDLERLDISGTDGLTVASLCAIGACCPRLRALELAGLSRDSVVVDTTDACIHAIAEGCPLLRELDLTAWVHLTDAALVAVVSGCPLLERLTLADCDKVTDVGIIAIATHCPRLRALDVSDCRLLTDESIVRGLVHCKELEELSPSFVRSSLALSGRRLDSLSAASQGSFLRVAYKRPDRQRRHPARTVLPRPSGADARQRLLHADGCCRARRGCELSAPGGADCGWLLQADGRRSAGSGR